MPKYCSPITMCRHSPIKRRRAMQVKELMTEKPEFINANCSIREAAQRMAEQCQGFAPVADSERLVGVVTDRDIATRAMVNGRTSEDQVTPVITAQVLLGCEDEQVDELV